MQKTLYIILVTVIISACSYENKLMENQLSAVATEFEEICPGEFSQCIDELRELMCVNKLNPDYEVESLVFKKLDQGFWVKTEGKFLISREEGYSPRDYINYSMDYRDFVQEYANSIDSEWLEEYAEYINRGIIPLEKSFSDWTFLLDDYDSPTMRGIILLHYYTIIFNMKN